MRSASRSLPFSRRCRPPFCWIPAAARDIIRRLWPIAVHQAAPDASVLGADISKAALSAAAKRTKEAAFAVASAFALPVPDDSVDILTSVFSPFCQSEFRRVLKAGGVFLEVIPSARHLFGLKAVLYDRPYENKVKPYAIAGFAFLNKREVSGEITLTDPADIAALFQMTPYAYRTPAEAVKRLSALPSLRTGNRVLRFWLTAPCLKPIKQKRAFSSITTKRKGGFTMVEVKVCVGSSCHIRGFLSGCTDIPASDPAKRAGRRRASARIVLPGLLRKRDCNRCQRQTGQQRRHFKRRTDIQRGNFAACAGGKKRRGGINPVLKEDKQ